MAKRWYIVQAYSNFERKVAEDIRQKVAQKKLEHLFEDVIVPTEKVVEIRRGRKVDAERKFFPGYVLVKMDMTDEAFHLIKNTPKVTWPSRNEVLISTIMVLVLVTFASLFFLAADQLISWLVGLMLSINR